MYHHDTASTSFHLAADAADAFPMFGPIGEKLWAGPDWKPQVLWPAEERDVEGMVFRLPNGSVWVNVRFDRGAGIAEYIHFFEDVVTRIRVEIRALDAETSRAEVHYAWTATTSAAAQRVIERAAATRESLPAWSEKINAALRGEVLSN